jgi:hypothetical protein
MVQGREPLGDTTFEAGRMGQFPGRVPTAGCVTVSLDHSVSSPGLAGLR